MITEEQQKELDQKYEALMEEVKKKDIALYHKLRSQEIPIKESN